MLQPSQIESVSARYGNEIAEVRQFLRLAGFAVETAPVLGEVVQRLRADRTFHRDLGSHVWMLLYSGAGVPDVLGVLAVAAAGRTFAARADEETAHDLLRFVMESRRSLGDTSAERPVAAVAEMPRPVPATVQPVTPAPAAVFQPGTLRAITPAIGVPDESLLEEPLHTRPGLKDAAVRPHGRGRLALVAVCLLAFALAGFWWYRTRSAGSETVAAPAPVVDGSASAPVAKSSVIEPAPVIVVAPDAASVPTPSRSVQTYRKPAAGRSLSPTVPARPTYPPPRSASPGLQPAYPQPVTSAPAYGAAVSQPVARAANTAPAPVVRSAAPRPLIPSGVIAAKPAAPPVPATVLSGRLGSPTVNAANAEDDRVEGTRGYPRLLRRKALDANGTLMAKAAPVSVPNVRAAAIPSGTVRSTSLGISAGNLVYAPDPPYPSAAASQHVSGQVTLEAMVDREGNVASARVISGPPMLRDAAVNAVQQWRYRPLLAHGKAQTFTATAVLDFQLQ